MPSSTIVKQIADNGWRNLEDSRRLLGAQLITVDVHMNQRA